MLIKQLQLDNPLDWWLNNRSQQSQLIGLLLLLIRSSVMLNELDDKDEWMMDDNIIRITVHTIIMFVWIWWLMCEGKMFWLCKSLFLSLALYNPNQDSITSSFFRLLRLFIDKHWSHASTTLSLDVVTFVNMFTVNQYRSIHIDTLVDWESCPTDVVGPVQGLFSFVCLSTFVGAILCN